MINEWMKSILLHHHFAFAPSRLCCASSFLSTFITKFKMPLKLDTVLITDEVDPKCVSILESNGVKVTFNTKLARDKPALLAEVAVSYTLFRFQNFTLWPKIDWFPNPSHSKIHCGCCSWNYETTCIMLNLETWWAHRSVSNKSHSWCNWGM